LLFILLAIAVYIDKRTGFTYITAIRLKAREALQRLKRLAAKQRGK
jgi:hypothetical protein